MTKTRLLLTAWLVFSALWIMGTIALMWKSLPREKPGFSFYDAVKDDPQWERR